MGKYKGLEAERREVIVTDEDVDKELENIRKRNARIVTASRPAAIGDTAIIDFEGTIGGTPFEGGKGENHNLVLGSGQFVPGFEEQFPRDCVLSGEMRISKSPFPDDYHKEFAGKNCGVPRKAYKEIKESILADLDDEFANDVSEFEYFGRIKRISAGH